MNHRTRQAASVQRRHPPGSGDQSKICRSETLLSALLPARLRRRWLRSPWRHPHSTGTGDLGSVEPRSGIADRIRHVGPLTCCILAHERYSRWRAPRSPDRDGSAIDVDVRSPSRPESVVACHPALVSSMRKRRPAGWSRPRADPHSRGQDRRRSPRRCRIESGHRPDELPLAVGLLPEVNDRPFITAGSTRGERRVLAGHLRRDRHPVPGRSRAQGPQCVAAHAD